MAVGVNYVVGCYYHAAAPTNPTLPVAAVSSITVDVVGGGGGDGCGAEDEDRKHGVVSDGS